MEREANGEISLLSSRIREKNALTLKDVIAGLIQNYEVTVSYTHLDLYKRQVLLCFTLFKTGSLAKGVFSAH